MGCTSSAPNIPPTRTNSEKDISLKEELRYKEQQNTKEPGVTIHHKDTEINGIKVLSPCDTLDEHIQLDRNNDRNNKSIVDTPTSEPPEQVSDLQTSEDVLKTGDASIHNSPSNESLHSVEKLSKMEEVVEKVVELYVDNALEKPQDPSSKTEVTNIAMVADHTEETKDALDTGGNEDLNREENLEEMVSPTQSQSSRATRWEALADIAAELPPSLTVDPLTGQIYAVSK